LSGITKVERGVLVVRNRIYRRVFDEEWIKLNIPDAELRRQRAAKRRGLLTATAISLGILTIMLILVGALFTERKNAKEVIKFYEMLLQRKR